MRKWFIVCQCLILLYAEVDWDHGTHDPMGRFTDYKEKREALVSWAQQNYDTRSALQTHLGYVGACLMVKNEHSSIREWVQYHLWLGVSKIYIIDNASFPPLSILLQDFIKKGQVDTFYYTTSLQADDFEIDKQENKWTNTYIVWGLLSCLQWYGHRHQWMINVDVDEFIVFPNDLKMKLPTFLRQYEQYGGVHIYRKYFSSGGHVHWPNGTALESYTWCAPDVDTFWQAKQYKWAVNMQFFTGRASVHWLRTLRPQVNGLGVPKITENVRRGIYKPTFDGICLHHYYTKSYDELALKWQRRFGSTIPNGFNQFSDQALQGKVDRYYNMINGLTKERCMEGVYLSRMCCSDIQNIPPNFTDWASIIQKFST